MNLIFISSCPIKIRATEHLISIDEKNYIGLDSYIYIISCKHDMIGAVKLPFDNRLDNFDLYPNLQFFEKGKSFVFVFLHVFQYI